MSIGTVSCGRPVLAPLLLVCGDWRLGPSLRQWFSDTGFVADLAVTSGGGVQMASRGHYAVIVLASASPKIDGLTLARRMRTAGTLAPIVIFNADDFAEALPSALGERDLMVTDHPADSALRRLADPTPTTPPPWGRSPRRPDPKPARRRLPRGNPKRRRGAGTHDDMQVA